MISQLNCCFTKVAYYVFITMCFLEGCKISDIDDRKSTLVIDTSAAIDESLSDNSDYYDDTDSIPWRFLSYEERLSRYPKERNIRGLDMTYQLNGSYAYHSSDLTVLEYYPGSIEYFGNEGLEKIIYYDSLNEEILGAFFPMDSIPLNIDHDSVIKYGHFGGEVYSYDASIPFKGDFKTNCDSLLVDVDLFRWLNSPYKVLSYYVWGINESRFLTGFECIVVILNEEGSIIYRKTFDKFLVNAFVSESNTLVCLNFSSPSYTNEASSTGALVIDEIAVEKTLLNRFLTEDEGAFGGQLSLQEVSPDDLFFDFDIRTNKRNNQYQKTGFIDLKSRRLYYKYWSEAELVFPNKHPKNLIENIQLSEWSLESSF